MIRIYEGNQALLAWKGNDLDADSAGISRTGEGVVRCYTQDRRFQGDHPKRSEKDLLDEYFGSKVIHLVCRRSRRRRSVGHKPPSTLYREVTRGSVLTTAVQCPSTGFLAKHRCLQQWYGQRTEFSMTRFLALANLFGEYHGCKGFRHQKCPGNELQNREEIVSIKLRPGRFKSWRPGARTTADVRMTTRYCNTWP